MERTTKAFCTLAGCALAMLAGCTRGQEGSSGREPVPVSVITLEEQAETGSLNYVGTVRASRTAVLSCSYPGTLASMPVSVGDIVGKGDTIAIIISQNVLSTKQMADATLAQAKDGYKRLSQVYDSGSVAEVKMVEVQSQLNKAEAAAEAAAKALEDCTVTAPFSGVIGEEFCEEGVETGAMEPLVRLMDISSVEIEFPVPENEIGSIGKRESFTVEVPALGGARFQAVVKTKGVSASPLSHSYSCTLSPSGQVEGLLPGMVCKVYRDSEGAGGIIVPASVVRTDGNGRYVWTVADGKVVKKYIVTGKFAGKGVAVEDGLEAGDRVIVEGSQKVSSGMKVDARELEGRTSSGER